MSHIGLAFVPQQPLCVSRNGVNDAQLSILPDVSFSILNIYYLFVALYVCIKYQTLDIEFLVVLLALYSRC